MTLNNHLIKRRAIVLEIYKENSDPRFIRALLDIDGVTYDSGDPMPLMIEVIPTVRRGDLVYVSEEAVQEALRGENTR